MLTASAASDYPTSPRSSASSAKAEFFVCLAHALDAEEQLLEDYSALFLVPPVPVPLNAGLYLDGGLLGRGTQAMLQRYGEAGLAPDERFRDLPDHVSMQLEYVAAMFARAADGDPACAERASEFLAQFILGWIPAFTRALQAAAQRTPAARAYGALAAILEAASLRETLPQSDGEKVPARPPQPRGGRAARRMGARGVRRTRCAALRRAARGGAMHQLPQPEKLL